MASMGGQELQRTHCHPHGGTRPPVTDEVTVPVTVATEFVTVLTDPVTVATESMTVLTEPVTCP